jgi:periplasmic divalent cation tolerance protein
MAGQILLAISTFPDAETAGRIAQILVEEKFAACANVMPAVHSIYRWKGKIETAGEVIVFFKTTKDQQTAFQEKLRSLHPYEVPEIIFVPVNSGLPAYLRWVAEGCVS